jgi:hypothetical protein
MGRYQDVGREIHVLIAIFQKILENSELYIAPNSVKQRPGRGNILSATSDSEKFRHSSPCSLEVLSVVICMEEILEVVAYCQSSRICRALDQRRSFKSLSDSDAVLKPPFSPKIADIEVCW